mmetsp:Transcript_22095/g.39632  ORF Transcript_22095/g.39632 Transcript_22095/m.39632 type:complete len:571 (-) Transcript_22095:222-1934(-)|eukprot:CAMPEP_0197661014 /NCGR_PEP_ID=MMETSP1338-20131121/51196_1 /TAXON_ID=43686 ORGANISM="Pelagodinium beii, Strain RCC1491" /NCGR_SAMPLE_ID=MMETSP1338 /ASSEMBLY_ACC=CAM_ASM_000754 /LENGTH=570 /DNA_ID=CAMNT_0043238481 /DNA_START=135 /DNA_END=1847 /DNA_ORIENTATION=-
MGTLKIHDNKLDKDQWDNVPQVIYKALKINDENMKNIKGWSSAVEQRSMKNAEIVVINQGRLDASEGKIIALQDRMDKAEDELVRLADVGRHQALSAAGSLQRLDRCVATLFGHIGKTFGVDLTKITGDAYLEEGEGQKDEGKDAEKQATEEERDEVEGEEKDSAESKDEEQASEQLPPGVAIMDCMGCGLEANLDGIEEAFTRWTQWRHSESDRREGIEANIEELRNSTDRTRQRILTWREMLKESSHGIDSLGQSLARTQAAVQELRVTSVHRRDVDAIMRTKAEELQSLNRLTEKSVEKLASRVEDHTTDVQRLIADSKRQSDEKLEEHNTRVSQMVERHMNPLNAYLNKMHVKTDVMRVELDKYGEQMPKLAIGLDDLSKKLNMLDEASRGKASEILDDIQKLSESLVNGLSKGEVQHSEMGKILQELGQDLGERIEVVQQALDAITESLESVKRDDLNGLARELMSLDQKVAKWVHAHPLPAKISEARLYSLEARLADEMDARMFFESKVRAGARNLTPRRGSSIDSSPVDVLPQLDSTGSERGSMNSSLKKDRRMRVPPPSPAP